MDTTEKAPPALRPPSARVTLRVLYSGGVLGGEPIALAEGGTLIGRSRQEGAICLPEDRLVSRVHAVLLLESQGLPWPRLRVQDISKNNGTFINGERTSEGPLRDGDVLRVGASFLLVRVEEARSGAEPPADAELIGVSAGARALRAAIAVAAPSMATVLLRGETGTGKEVAARLLHRGSGRTGPLVAINCSAIPEALAESQLFGHTAGAFTGAVARPGLFRAAEGGTLFLDEIGDLSAVLQPKLLRAIEERAVLPVGATSPVPCDVRIIAATHRDLAAGVRAGTFRGDLYARLAELTLSLPPLRERREDILLILSSHLGAAPPLSTELIEALLLYGWPYNVRELCKLATELRVRGADADRLHLALVADRLRGGEPLRAATPAPAPAPEPRPPRPVPDRAELLALLVEHKGVVADIARAVGRSRMQVYRWLEQQQIDATHYRKPP